MALLRVCAHAVEKLLYTGLIKKREFGNLDDMSWNQPDKELQAAEEYRAKQAKLRKKAASQKQKSGVSASVVPAQ